jgi:hypothetical protein
MTLIVVDVEVFALCPRPSASQGGGAYALSVRRAGPSPGSLSRCKNSHHARHLRGFEARACLAVQPCTARMRVPPRHGEAEV